MSRKIMVIALVVAFLCSVQNETHYLGMVVAPDGSFLADSQVEGRPTVNDMATLLAHAMKRPLAKGARRR